MLRTLHIRNVILIDEVTIEFTEGMNILTGETGAGKSVLIESLGLALGERASHEIVREGADRAVVEATFDVSGNKTVRRLLEENGYESEDELIVRREVHMRGTSRAFLNDSPAPLSLVRSVGDHLVDLHGQHDHQTLLRPELHVHLLDESVGVETAPYRAGYQRLLELHGELRRARQEQQEIEARRDYIIFQLREIDSVDPQPEEDTKIETELRVLENAERIAEHSHAIRDALADRDGAARDLLIQARQHLDALAELDESLTVHRDECRSAVAVIDEIVRGVEAFQGDIEYSPQRIEQLRERLSLLSRLRKRHGGSLAAALEERERLRAELERAENMDERIAAKEQETESQRAVVAKLALALTEARRHAAAIVEKQVGETLRQLGIKHGVLEVRFGERHAAGDQLTLSMDGVERPATSHGVDEIEFYISTNVGESARPLSRTASGGEISRIMLALKTVLAKNERLPLLVFDEIDAGISGRIASKVGAVMRDLARYHQIIAITHLPQIAAMGTRHLLIEKYEDGGRVVTDVRNLDETGRVEEVARLMSGESVTESSRRMARELLEQ